MSKATENLLPAVDDQKLIDRPEAERLHDELDAGRRPDGNDAGRRPDRDEPPHPHHIAPWKVVVVLAILAAIVIAVALFGYLPRKKREEAAANAAHEEATTLPVVTAARIHRAPADTEVLLPGNITPIAEAPIFARASGYVRKRYVDIGDHVRQGQLMAEIETPELDQQVAGAQAAVSQARQQLSQTRASLVQAEAQRDLAKVTADRYTALVARGAVARQDADQQVANYKTSEALVGAQQANVRAAEDNVRASQANLERVIALRNFQSVRAPITGIVTARNVDVGSLISATGSGQGIAQTQTTGAANASGGEMFRVARIDTLRIYVSVPQANAPGIQVGLPATMSVNEFPGRKFIGKVTRIANSLDPASRTMLAEIQVPNRDGNLYPGMYAQVRFENHRASPPLLVPGDSLIVSGNGLQVAILENAPEARSDNPADRGAKKIHLQTVSVGRDYGPETEVTAGLQGWETVVINPGDDVREGSLVKPESTGESKGKTAATPPGSQSDRQPSGIGTQNAASQKQSGASGTQAGQSKKQ